MQKNKIRRWKKVERQEVVHGLIGRPKIHNHVWDRANNCLGWYWHERWEVVGGRQIHGLLNCVVILDTVQSYSNESNLKRWWWRDIASNEMRTCRWSKESTTKFTSSSWTLSSQTGIWYKYYTFSFRASKPYCVISSFHNGWLTLISSRRRENL